jgi:hypothetical protein
MRNAGRSMPKTISTSCAVHSKIDNMEVKMTNYRTKKGRELLAQNIESYFLLCDTANSFGHDQKIRKPAKPYTLSGLLYHLDMSAVELEALCETRSLSKLVSGAKRRIEAYIEENALNGNLSSTAAFNSLKEHFGWSAKDTETSDDTGFTVELSEDAERFGA